MSVKNPDSPRQRPAQPAAHIDVLHTLAELCDVPLPRDLELDGMGLAELLVPSETGGWVERTLTAAFGTSQEMAKGRSDDRPLAVCLRRRPSAAV
jgi:hypothetical protein